MWNEVKCTQGAGLTCSIYVLAQAYHLYVEGEGQADSPDYTLEHNVQDLAG